MLLPTLLGTAVLLLLMVRGIARRTREGDGHPIVLAGVLALACALVGAGAIALLADRRDPFDPRSQQAETVDRAQTINPLLTLKSNQRLDPPADILTIRLEAGDEAVLVDRLPIAVLDTYDGTSWTFTGRFTASASTLSPEHEAPTGSALVTQRMTLRRLVLPWLPAARTAVAVSLDGVQYDDEHEMLIAPDLPLPLDYTVDSLVAQFAVEGFDIDPDQVDLSSVPAEVPASLRDLAVELAGDLGPADRAVRLESHLRESYASNPDAPAGHSLRRLESVLIDGDDAGPEQFAAAMAVLARLQGLPARVVVGLRLPSGDGGTGPVTLTTADLDAWTEIHFDDVGWLPFDPTGTAVDSPDDNPAPTTTLATTAFDRPISPTEAGPDEATPDEAGSSSSGVLVFGLLLLGAVLAVLAWVAMVRRRKRNRRDERLGSPRPAEQLLGAWYEMTDRLVEHGFRIAPTMTIAEITRAAADQFSFAPTSEVWRLGASAARAAYDQAPVGRADAESAWEGVARIERELDRRRSKTQRLRAWLSSQPFRRPDL